MSRLVTVIVHAVSAAYEMSLLVQVRVVMVDVWTIRAVDEDVLLERTSAVESPANEAVIESAAFSSRVNCESDRAGIYSCIQ